MIQKFIIALAGGAAALCFTSCGMTSGTEVADYNRDGIISDAEYRQYQMGENVQQRELQTDAQRRAGVRDTMHTGRSVSSGVLGIGRDIQRIDDWF